MVTRVVVKPNAYYDSVTLMAITQKVTNLPGVSQSVVVMGTPMNKELLQNVGLLNDVGIAALPTDLVIAAAADDADVLDHAFAQVDALLQPKAPPGAPSGATAAPRTIAAGAQVEGANLALISVPGLYAPREARLALEHGLHVMLYSDNVSLADERDLKQLAHAKGLLLMGPDCGTAIINGVGLGFANAVRRGPIGIVAASGTGAQELSMLIDQLGSGISQLVGTGGRDLSAAIGGQMTIDAIDLLEADPETTVIVVISKPPAPAVSDRVVHQLQMGLKPFVLCLVGARGGVSIDEAATKAVAIVTGQSERAMLGKLGYVTGGTAPVGVDSTRAPSERRFVRGLFSGGTLCDQALLILEDRLGPIWCNIHPVAERRGGVAPSQGHILIDLGDDAFTVGRPHPMIDPTLRRQHLLQTAEDPTVAVILLDLVIGYGSHPDPAGALAGAISTATQAGITVIASVTGTETDPQRLSAQVLTLRAAGATVLPTARLAAMTAATRLEGRVHP